MGERRTALLLRRDRAAHQRQNRHNVVNPSWLRFSFPVRWHQGVRRALDYSRAVDGVTDARLAEAIRLFCSKEQPDSRWLLENTYPGRTDFALEPGDGLPSRWNTLRALRVLGWYEGRASGSAHWGTVALHEFTLSAICR